jgi:hypothetical protein
MAATVLTKENTLALAANTAVQVVSGSGGKRWYNFINRGPGNLLIRTTQAPTGATDVHAFTVPVNPHPRVRIYVEFGQTGLWLLADQAGSVSIYDEIAI